MVIKLNWASLQQTILLPVVSLGPILPQLEHSPHSRRPISWDMWWSSRVTAIEEEGKDLVGLTLPSRRITEPSCRRSTHLEPSRLQKPSHQSECEVRSALSPQAAHRSTWLLTGIPAVQFLNYALGYYLLFSLPVSSDKIYWNWIIRSSRLSFNL